MNTLSMQRKPSDRKVSEGYYKFRNLNEKYVYWI